LPAAEQALAQLLIQRAREIQPEQVRGQALRVALSEATRTAFNVTESNLHPGAEASVEIGPIWQKADKVEWGEEVEIIQRVDLRGNISPRR
jgi:hypothetical protein